MNDFRKNNGKVENNLIINNAISDRNKNCDNLIDNDEEFEEFGEFKSAENKTNNNCIDLLNL